jgi:hypothetical protein
VNGVSLLDDVERRVRRQLSLGLRPPADAGAVATDLLVLSTMGRDASALIDEFRQAVEAAGLLDVLGQTLRYAERLATASGPLLYEEIFKLVGLREEVRALYALGFAADPSWVRTVEDLISVRFATQPDLANDAVRRRNPTARKG